MKSPKPERLKTTGNLASIAAAIQRPTRQHYTVEFRSTNPFKAHIVGLHVYNQPWVIAGYPISDPVWSVYTQWKAKQYRDAAARKLVHSPSPKKAAGLGKSKLKQSRSVTR